MASRDKKDLHPKLVLVVDTSFKIFKDRYPDEPQPFITCTYRSFGEQDELFSIGRTKPGKKITQAKAGESPHNFNPSFAYDVGFLTIAKKMDWSDHLFKKLADLTKEITEDVDCGIDWKFKDAPHFELKGWKNR